MLRQSPWGCKNAVLTHILFPQAFVSQGIYNAVQVIEITAHDIWPYNHWASSHIIYSIKFMSELRRASSIKYSNWSAYILNASMKRVFLPTEPRIMHTVRPHKSITPWSKRFSFVWISAVLLHITKGFTDHLWTVNVTSLNHAIDAQHKSEILYRRFFRESQSVLLPCRLRSEVDYIWLVQTNNTVRANLKSLAESH